MFRVRTCTLGRGLKFFFTLFINDDENAKSIDFGVTNKFQRVDELANMESENNKD